VSERYPDPNELIPDRKVAERYDVHPKTIKRWDADLDLGFAPAVEINGRFYRRRGDLEKFERSRVRARASNTAA
jgi:predicted chitinase